MRPNIIVSMFLLALCLFAVEVAAQESPDKTTVPPAPSITDADGRLWVMGNDPVNPPLTIATDLLLYCNKIVYAREATTGIWHRAAVGGWIVLGTAHPCP